MSMLSARLLFLIVSTSHVWTAILEDAGQVDLEAVRIRLEEEKAKRLLLQNDVEVLKLQLEELKRKYDQKENKGPAILEDVGRTDLEADRTQLEKTSRSLSQNDFDLLTQQVKELLLLVEELKRKSDQKDSNGCNPSAGTTYIRWGRTICPGNGTELAYKGYMAGSEFSNTGSGPNHLCLPEDPTWAKYKDGNANPEYRNHVYGTEYEMGVNGEFTVFSDAVLRNDAPCAVCRTTRSASIMIPGRTNCYSGWTAEYSGYLVSNYYRHPASSDYVCLDGNPEPIVGGASHQSGHLLYLVDVKCGTLRCPPYVDGRELACVVCSK